MSDPDRLLIRPGLSIPLSEIDLSQIRASGPGGQHVNKTASAVQLRFDISASSLPESIRERLIERCGRSVIILTADRHRVAGQNRSEALERLARRIAAAAITPKRRIATKPSRASKERRIDGKRRRSATKNRRQRPGYDD
jgi:ribosome-associated protein